MAESGGGRRLRYVGYSVAVTLAFFALVNVAIEGLEDQRVLETGRTDQASQLTGRTDQVSQVLEERLWRRVSSQWKRTDYAYDIVPSRDFLVKKADGFRAFVLGASFAEGTPYPLDAAQGGGGGIASFVEAELRRRNPGRVIEVVNAAASGRNSTWVRDVAREVLEYDPDVLIVASCNNEGTPAPGWMNEYLRRQGAYRMLTKLLRPDAGTTSRRSWYTPQDPDTTLLREQFAANIRTLVEEAGNRGTQVLLATLPINLRYTGFELGHVIEHEGPEPGAPEGHEPGGAENKGGGPTAWPGLKQGPVPAFFADSDPCNSGIVAFEAGFPAEAAALLRSCAAPSPGSDFSAAPEGLWDYVAAAEIAAGHSSDEARRRLQWRFGDCVSAAIIRYHAGDPEGALVSLDGCDDIEEALRWKGLALAATGDVTSARALLRQAVELRPRNRCRPSFNDLLREEAARSDHVRLVDLERAAEEVSPAGLPGPGLFIDYCHMSWRGYAEMSRAVLAELYDLRPELNPGSAPLPGVDDLGRLLEMPDESVLVQIARYNSLRAWDVDDEQAAVPGPEISSPKDD